MEHTGAMRGEDYEAIIQNRHAPSGYCRVYQATQLRTDGVHYPRIQRHRASSPQGSSINGELPIQHAVLVSELEAKFADDSSTTASVTSNSLEPRGWGVNDDTSPSVGSAANPIEIDDDNEGDQTPQAGTRGAWTRQGSWQHVVNEGDLSPGDQIYGYRGVIQHHGIVTYVPWARGHNGNPTAASHLSPSVVHVVHFDSSCDGVETTSLEAFLKGGILRRARYSSSNWSASLNIGASYACSADDPALIVRRATEAARFGEGISGWSGYCLLTNNCETFAFWSCTGRRQTLSRQASRGLVGAGLVAAGVSAAASAMIPRAISGVDQTIKAMQWATGIAAVTTAVADALTEKATNEPVARNRAGGDAMEES